MSEPTDDDTAAIDAETLDRALARLRPKIPLTHDELKSLRELIEEWEYQKRRKAERKRNWPVITLLVSFLTTAAGWGVSLWLSHVAGPKP